MVHSGASCVARFSRAFCHKIFMATQVFLCCIFWTFFQSFGNFGDPSVIQVWWLPETTRDTSCGMSEIFKGELGSEVKGFILGWKDSAERTVAHNLNEIWHGCESWSGNGPRNVSRVERIRWSDLLSRQEFDSDFEFIFWFWGGWDGCCYKSLMTANLPG